MRIVSLALFLSLICGCATLFASGPDHVQVVSNPPGAQVYVDNVQVGVTPMTVALDRSKSQGNIRVEAPGYQPAITQRSKTFNTVAILNCVNVIFWVVDLVTANHQVFDSTAFNVNLVPAGGAPGGYVAPPPPPAGYPAPAPVPGPPPSQTR